MSWEEEHLAGLKIKAAGLLEALTQMGDGRQEYWMNTGQTSLKVVRADIASLESTYKSTLNMIATLEARLGIGRGGVSFGRPMC